jgi:hypothetical protein
LLVDALKARCVGKLVKVGSQRKFRRCVAVSDDGDLDLDMSFALRYTFAPDIIFDASIYDKVTVADSDADADKAEGRKP